MSSTSRADLGPGARGVVATEPDLGDYFRLPRADSKARVAELVAAGELLRRVDRALTRLGRALPTSGTRRPR